MDLLRNGSYLLFVCLCVFIRPSAGNAWLMDPPSRSAAWNYGIRAPINYDFRTLDCGNEKVNIQPDGTRNCGLCGDPITDPVPRPNENGGIYAPATILTRFFVSGTTAEISIYNNYPNQPGYYEFRICENGNNPTQACLDNHLLFVTNSSDTKMPVPGQGLNRIHVQLPAGLTCSHCLLQWRFKKDNSAWGCDTSTGWCGLGYGPQKEYYNCADIMIGAVGTPKPDTIQDPTYTSADYGSAYDTATQGPTTPDRVVGTTTTPRRIITVPTVTSTATPITKPTTPEQDDRLVVIDASDSGNPVVIFSDDRRNNNNNNNAGLLLLLGLLPLLGAMGQTGGGGAVSGPLPLPAPQPPLSSSSFWNTGGFGTVQPYSSNYALGNNFGYGNYGGAYGGSYGSQGSYYGNQNSYYGNSGSMFGNTLGSSINGLQIQNGIATTNNINTLGSNNFVVKREAYVSQNGITRQRRIQATPNISNTQGQQNQYQTNQQQQYPTGWPAQQKGNSNNQIGSFHNQNPAPSNAGSSRTSWQSSGWSNGNNNAVGSGFGGGNTNGFSNIINNGFSNVNNNGLASTRVSALNTNFNNGNNRTPSFGNTGLDSNWNIAGQTPGFTHISHVATTAPWQQGNSQTVGKPTFLGGSINPQTLNQGFENFSQSLPERPM